MGYLFGGVERWINLALTVLMLLIQLWSVADCASRRAQAFPAVNKLTKPVWLAILIGGTALSALLFFTTAFGPFNIISLITLVTSCVYLADVRPAVREISGGSGQRW